MQPVFLYIMVCLFCLGAYAFLPPHQPHLVLDCTHLCARAQSLLAFCISRSKARISRDLSIPKSQVGVMVVRKVRLRLGHRREALKKVHHFQKFQIVFVLIVGDCTLQVVRKNLLSHTPLQPRHFWWVSLLFCQARLQKPNCVQMTFVMMGDCIFWKIRLVILPCVQTCDLEPNLDS